ncbi:aminopeptidase [Desulfovibrio desulfuricans]|uniref:aminopeptidase n=1 Tax=Desulfovibrio desulfuricans TaxID=876 RepID=UPI0035ADAB84
MEKSLAYKPKNIWDDADAKTRKEMEALAQRYIEFLTCCKTERETVEYVRLRLAEHGYTEDFGGDKVMRPLRGKAIFAARKGALPLSQGLSLLAAHADTPRLDFKQRPIVEQPGVAQAKTHYYGGIRKYQWLARPLALHGVIVRENGETLAVTIGEKPGEPVFCIADLLPHLAQKQVTQPVSEAFEAEKLNIILAHSTPKAGKTSKDDAPKDPVKTQLLELLHKKYGICEEDFITAELQAVPAGPARFVGFDKAMIGGYGQDDRICVFTALEALLEAENTGRSMAVMFWDKEEIGSDGATGAASRFMQYCIEDLARAWEKNVPSSHVLLETRALSADVSAALDPDYQDVHEKQNAALLGYGPVFSKFTGSRGKYGASEADAEFFGVLRGLFNGKGIAWQAAELGKVDHGGGGTVALFLAAYGMQVIDLGPAILSMHSPFELASSADLFATKQAFRAFLEAQI